MFKISRIQKLYHFDQIDFLFTRYKKISKDLDGFLNLLKEIFPEKNNAKKKISRIPDIILPHFIQVILDIPNKNVVRTIQTWY